MKQLLILAMAAASLSACSTVQKSRTVKTTDIYGPGVMHLPVIADLDVQEQKVTGRAEGRSTASIEVLKLDAIADALKASNADVLVEPIFDIVVDGNQKTVKVTGFPGHYRNFRKMVPADTLYLVPGVNRKPQAVEQNLERKKRKQPALLVM